MYNVLHLHSSAWTQEYHLVGGGGGRIMLHYHHQNDTAPRWTEPLSCFGWGARVHFILHCHHQNDPASMKLWAGSISHFNVFVRGRRWGQILKTVS